MIHWCNVRIVQFDGFTLCPGSDSPANYTTALAKPGAANKYAYVTECVYVFSSTAMYLVLIELYKVKYLHE